MYYIKTRVVALISRELESCFVLCPSLSTVSTVWLPPSPYQTSWQYNWKRVSVRRVICQGNQYFIWVFFYNLSVKRSYLYNQMEQACSSVSTTLADVSKFFSWKLKLFPRLTQPSVFCFLLRSVVTSYF